MGIRVIVAVDTKGIVADAVALAEGEAVEVVVVVVEAAGKVIGAVLIQGNRAVCICIRFHLISREHYLSVGKFT